MSSELLALLLSALLLLVLALVYAGGRTVVVGMPAMLGNRDEPSTTTGWSARGQRAHLNLLENLVPFAIAVLVAHAVGVSTDLTRLGAWLFLGARLLHAISYIGGITVVRTIAYHLGTLGTLLIAIPALLRGW